MAARFGTGRTLSFGMAISTFGAVHLAPVGPDTGNVALAIGGALIGKGGGLLAPLLTSVILGSADKELSGVASGALNAFQQLGGAARGARSHSSGLRPQLPLGAGLLRERPRKDGA